VNETAIDTPDSRGTLKRPRDGRLTAHESQFGVIRSDFNARQPRRRRRYIAHLRPRVRFVWPRLQCAYYSNNNNR